MSAPVSSIRNLGPASDAAFARAGIHDAETLRRLGADEGYRRLLAAGGQPHFIGYYALVMGLQGRPWNDCRGAEKAALRVRFDAIRADAAAAGGPPPGIEAALDAIGTGDPARRTARRQGPGGYGPGGQGPGGQGSGEPLSPEPHAGAMAGRLRQPTSSRPEKK